MNSPSRGFFHDPSLDPAAWTFGTGELLADAIQPDRQWTPWLPTVEDQLSRGFDPLSCASYGTLNVAEIYLRRVFGEERDYSDRFLAFQTGTRDKFGNDPHFVCEWLRHSGDVPEDKWPFLAEVDTYDRYYAEPPAHLSDEAKTFTTEWSLKHDTVRKGSYPTLQDAMWDALQYSPLGVSVGFNAMDEKGYVYKNGSMNDWHWCSIVGGLYGDHFLIFDSANGAIKKAAWSKLNPQLVKRISITKRMPTVEELSIFVQILTAIRDWWIGYRAQTPAIAPISPVAPSNMPDPNPQPSTADRLYNAAVAAIGKDVSPGDLANDEVGCAESLSMIIRQVIPSFPIILSTASLNVALLKHPQFKRIETPVPGCVAIAPTFGSKIGHCWVMGKTHAMSNTSATGKWEANYTNARVATDAQKRGLKLFYYLPL